MADEEDGVVQFVLQRKIFDVLRTDGKGYDDLIAETRVEISADKFGELATPATSETMRFTVTDGQKHAGIEYIVSTATFLQNFRMAKNRPKIAA